MARRQLFKTVSRGRHKAVTADPNVLVNRLSQIASVARDEDAGRSWVSQLFPGLRFIVKGSQEGEAAGIAPSPSLPTQSKRKGKQNGKVGSSPAATVTAIETGNGRQLMGTNGREMTQGDGARAAQVDNDASLGAHTAVDGTVRKLQASLKEEEAEEDAMPGAVPSVPGEDGGEALRISERWLMGDDGGIAQDNTPSKSKLRKEASRDVAAATSAVQHKAAAVGLKSVSNMPGTLAESQDVPLGDGDGGGELWSVVERKKQRRHALQRKDMKKRMTRHRGAGR